MIDRRLLALLFMMAFYIFYVRPQVEESQQLAGQNIIMRSSIAREQVLAEKLEQHPEKLTRLIEKIRFNRSLFFPAEMDNSSALGKLQQLIKQAAVASGVELNQSHWGEPIVVDLLNIARLPLSLTIHGGAAQLDQFRWRVLNSGILVEIETAQIQKKSADNLLLRVGLVGFKFLRPPTEFKDQSLAPLQVPTPAVKIEVGR